MFIIQSKNNSGGILNLRSSVLNGTPRNFTEVRYLIPAELKKSFNSAVIPLYGVPLDTLNYYCLLFPEFLEGNFCGRPELISFLGFLDFIDTLGRAEQKREVFENKLSSMAV